MRKVNKLFSGSMLVIPGAMIPEPIRQELAEKAPSGHGAFLGIKRPLGSDMQQLAKGCKIVAVSHVHGRGHESSIVQQFRKVGQKAKRFSMYDVAMDLVTQLGGMKSATRRLIMLNKMKPELRSEEMELHISRLSLVISVRRGGGRNAA